MARQIDNLEVLVECFDDVFHVTRVPVRVVKYEEAFPFLKQVSIHTERVLITTNRVLELLRLLQQFMLLFLFVH